MKLLADPEYFALTPEEKACICNGCGPSGDDWKSKLIPDKLLGVDFTEACNNHDFDYSRGLNKLQADWRLHCNMVGAVMDHAALKQLNPLEIHLLLIACDEFLMAVYEYGAPYFGVKK